MQRRKEKSHCSWYYSYQSTRICFFNRNPSEFKGYTNSITPGFSFKAIDRLITNFHLPKSSLMLVAAFVGMEEMKDLYNHAVETDIDFYHGDAMMVNKKMFEVINTSEYARAGLLKLRHGDVQTPAFMPLELMEQLRALQMMI